MNPLDCSDFASQKKLASEPVFYYFVFGGEGGITWAAALALRARAFRAVRRRFAAPSTHTFIDRGFESLKLHPKKNRHQGRLFST